MPKAQIMPVPLLAVVAAVGIMLLYAAANHGFGYETTVAGLTLLLALFAYDAEGYRPPFQSIAFASAGGLCFMLFAGFPIAAVMSPKSPDEWSASAWAAATLLFFAVDRLRATSQESASMALTAPAVPVSYSAPAPAPVVRPIVTPAPFTAAPFTAPIAPPPVSVAFEPPLEVPAQPEPPPVPYIPPPPAAPPSIAPIPPGREALIFLNLLGEGLNVLRSVKAEHLGRDYYRIADVKPENERWEYEPGQVVRARKKALSNGKHLVAFEEAPRAM